MINMKKDINFEKNPDQEINTKKIFRGKDML